MKTIEKQAAEFSKFDSATDIGTDFGSYRQGLFEGFIAGYKAGSEVTEQEIADIIVDIRQREAEERKRPQRERQARIWEKVKIKIIGVF